VAACLLAGSLGLRTPAYAYPDAEKITFDNASTDTGAFAAAAFPLFGYALLVNRNSDTVAIWDLQSMLPVQDPSTGTPVVIAVVDDPVAIATYVDNPGTPTKAYAFVAGYASNQISVIDLLSVPPAIMAAEQIDVAADSDTGDPGPVALLVDGGQLFVAAGDEGTVIQYSIASLPAAHVALAAGGQNTAVGNMVVCATGNSVPSSAKPRVLAAFGGTNYAGCNQGTVTSFGSTGVGTIRGDIAGGSGLRSVRGLVGDPRTSTSILYALDDTSDSVFALNVAAGSFDTVSVDPIISPLCATGGANQDSVPLPQNETSAAIVSFTDGSVSNGGSFVGVLTASSTAATLLLSNLSQIDTNSATNPECGLTGTNTLTTKVLLTKSKPFLSGAGGTTPAGIGQQMAYWQGYVGIPGYSSVNGSMALTLVTDNLKLTPAPDPLTKEALTDAVDSVFTTIGNVSTALVWSTDETAESAPSPVVFARKLGQPLTKTGLSPAVTTGTNVSFTVTSSALLSSGIVTASSNEKLEVVVAAYDVNGDAGFSAQDFIFDTTPPTMPASPGAVSVGIGDTILAVTVAGAADPLANSVRSGLDGFAVHFTAPTPGVPADQFYPATNGRFTLSGLTNNVAYSFDIYAVDAAGNVSATLLSATGTPVPGMGIIELTGEQGCALSPGARGGPAVLLLWGAAACAWLLRRKSGRVGA